MAHLLLLELPGGNDVAVLEDATRAGHDVTFVTGDLAAYRAQGDAVNAGLALARRIEEVRPFSDAALAHRAHAIHAETPLDAILCLLDIRMIAASQLAHSLGLRFLNPATARMTRDKAEVRAALARHGVRQPAFACAQSAEEVRRAVAEIGFPVVIKPADGYGSQDVRVLFAPDDLADLLAAHDARHPTDYGLGVRANGRMVVERYVQGAMIGCDVFSAGGQRAVLGINDKLMFPPPSFAIRGSCFPSVRHDTAAIGAYAAQVLDAIGFDVGAAHIEMIVAADGPYLVEVNPRLVSAQIPWQMGYALGRSVYLDLIDLHLGASPAALRGAPCCFSAIRWFAAERAGVLASVDLPPVPGPAVRRVVLFKAPGERVVPPRENGDRIGYVIAVGETQAAAEGHAEDYIAHTTILLEGIEALACAS